MKTINSMVADSLLGAITESDIEDAVNNIVEDMDIAELLSESDELKEAVYAAVDRVFENVLEAYL